MKVLLYLSLVALAFGSVFILIVRMLHTREVNARLESETFDSSFAEKIEITIDGKTVEIIDAAEVEDFCKLFSGIREYAGEAGNHSPALQNFEIVLSGNGKEMRLYPVGIRPGEYKSGQLQVEGTNKTIYPNVYFYDIACSLRDDYGFPLDKYFELINTNYEDSLK